MRSHDLYIGLDLFGCADLWRDVHDCSVCIPSMNSERMNLMAISIAMNCDEYR